MQTIQIYLVYIVVQHENSAASSTAVSCRCGIRLIRIFIVSRMLCVRTERAIGNKPRSDVTPCDESFFPVERAFDEDSTSVRLPPCPLAGNELGVEGMKALFEVVVKQKDRWVSFNSVPVRDLRTNQVNELLLGEKGIGDMGCMVLGKTLSLNTSLTVLDLQSECANSARDAARPAVVVLS